MQEQAATKGSAEPAQKEAKKETMVLIHLAVTPDLQGAIRGVCVDMDLHTGLGQILGVSFQYLGLNLLYQRSSACKIHEKINESCTMAWNYPLGEGSRPLLRDMLLLSRAAFLRLIHMYERQGNYSIVIHAWDWCTAFSLEEVGYFCCISSNYDVIAEIDANSCTGEPVRPALPQTEEGEVAFVLTSPRV